MSLLGNLLPPKSIPGPSKIAQCSRIGCNLLLRDSKGTRRGHSNDTRRRTVRWQKESSAQTIESVFIGALVQASSNKRCANMSRTSAAMASSTYPAQRTGRRYKSTTPPYMRAFSIRSKEQQANLSAIQLAKDTAEEEEVELGAHLPRQKYEDLANTYSIYSDRKPTSRDLARMHPQRALPSNYLPLAPRLVLTAEQEARPPYSYRQILPPIDEKHRAQIRRLWEMLGKGDSWRQNRSKSWELYQALPTPRPRYLRDNLLRKLLRSQAHMEFKTLEGSKRYFSLLDECMAEGVQLTAHDWNSAISFAGRWVKTISKEEVKTAVETWMRAENSGVAADHVTFNILFDVAIRAERFALADTIFDELKAREMPLNRHFRTSMIYYGGLRGDGDAVRKAFREFVNAGEIVDTAVMNCVMLSLVRAHEVASAESVFAKMKDLHVTKFGARGPRTWQQRKLLGERLDRTARELRQEKAQHETSFFGSFYSTEAKKEEAQRAAPIHPDRRSCEILLRYHARWSGNLSRVREMLQELKDGGWVVHGSVYVHIFRGFWLHGGSAYVRWDRDSLEEFWQEFLEGMGAPPRMPSAAAEAPDSHIPRFTENPAQEEREDQEEDQEEEDETSHEDLLPYFTPHLVIAVLNAFYKCAGAKRMLEVWQQVRDKWPEISDEDSDKVVQVVRRLSKEDGMYIS